MRRVIGDQHHDGGPIANFLSARSLGYDLDGRLVLEDRAIGFANNVPTGWQAWTTQYTPAGKVYAKIDPLGFGTYFDYDELDRERKSLDASGRATAKTWDLAGEQLTEVRGQGTPLQQNYQTFTWGADGEKTSVADANGNLVSLGYDGLGRLSAITFPDQSAETSQYDPDGDLTIWTNRGGFGVVRCYDADNRKVSEAGITGASGGAGVACPTGGTPNRTSRATASALPA